MGTDIFEISVNFLKMVAIFLLMVQLVPLLVWVERRGSAFIQNRYGPNRVGPLGLMQLAADGVKFLFKEEFVPPKGKKLLFYMAPVVALIPGAVAFGAIPLSIPIFIEPFEMFGSMWGPYNFALQSYEIGIGILFVLGVSSLGAYSMLLAGYGSGNKYSLLGALRACAQMISYELALGASILGILMVYGTFDFSQMIAAQQGPLAFTAFGREMVITWLPNWGIFYQPLGFVLFFICLFAETNRLPFDLPEAEGELVAGYHTEYGGIKFNMFFIGEYAHMMVGAGLLTTFFFGGYELPLIPGEAVKAWVATWIASPNQAQIVGGLLLHLVFMAKLIFFMWVFIWVRWTLPRFRYDQLMDLGWKKLLPWALGNTVATALLMFILSKSGV